MASTTTKKNIEQLKADYIEYFEDVPIQRYAAMAIGRDEDTIIRWRSDDARFAESVQIAKAKWVRKKMVSVKAEFALERLEKSVFLLDYLPPEDEIDYDAGPVEEPKNTLDDLYEMRDGLQQLIDFKIRELKFIKASNARAKRAEIEASDQGGSSS